METVVARERDGAVPRRFALAALHAHQFVTVALAAAVTPARVTLLDRSGLGGMSLAAMQAASAALEVLVTLLAARGAGPGAFVVGPLAAAAARAVVASFSQPAGWALALEKVVPAAFWPPHRRGGVGFLIYCPATAICVRGSSSLELCFSSFARGRESGAGGRYVCLLKRQRARSRLGLLRFAELL